MARRQASSAKGRTRLKFSWKVSNRSCQKQKALESPPNSSVAHHSLQETFEVIAELSSSQAGIRVRSPAPLHSINLRVMLWWYISGQTTSIKRLSSLSPSRRFLSRSSPPLRTRKHPIIAHDMRVVSFHPIDAFLAVPAVAERHFPSSSGLALSC